MEIIIERIPLEQIDINTNNHDKDPADEAVTELDYRVEVDRTCLSNYQFILEKYPHIVLSDWSAMQTFTFSQMDARYLIQAAESAIFTGKLPKCYDEELTDIMVKLDQFLADKSNDNGFFIRFDSVSPKDGVKPVLSDSNGFPVRTGQEIVTMLATSKRALRAFNRGDRQLHFLPFIPVNSDNEFRVFIYQRRITCISQYGPGRRTIFSHWSDERLTKLAQQIQETILIILDEILDTVGTDNVVCDVNCQISYTGTQYIEFDSDSVPINRTEFVTTCKIIEFNSFGYWLASGSCLYHWLKDKEKLYSTDPNQVRFRIYK